MFEGGWWGEMMWIRGGRRMGGGMMNGDVGNVGIRGRDGGGV